MMPPAFRVTALVALWMVGVAMLLWYAAPRVYDPEER